MTRAHRRKSKSPDTHIVFIVVIIVLAVFMASILMFASGAEANNDNVTKGKVKVSTGLFKICDGKNLVYTFYGNAVAVSPNDPQCY
jgi:flagellar basal body-associated protein FliL